MLGTFAPHTFAAGTFRCSTLGGVPLAAVHWLCLQAVQAKLQALNLVPSARVVILKFPSARDFGATRPGALPAIIVSPWGIDAMNPAEGTNRRDDVGYPVTVSIVAAANADLSTDNLPQYLLWRQTIARAFRNQPLPAVSGIYRVNVEPLPVADWPSFNGPGIWNSGLVLRCLSREVRGV